ncbi:dual specificity protein phosphatase 22-like [Clytia hemisphaerica]|uniref:dual specificity protein phosphatase 22-like n=1 Tax=Clytia hemisphaerica TaxID=252671 RepID=UPI0034D62E4B
MGSEHSLQRNEPLTKEQVKYVKTIAYYVQDLKHLPRGMTKVLDHLYLGDWEDATNVEKLKETGITHIINTVDELYENCRTKKEFYGPDIEYMGFTSLDDESYDIMKHFEEVHKFIESAKASGGKCFIHCMAGINRSGCLATAHVMLDQNMGPITAARFIFEKRGMLLSNSGFVERLVNFAVDRELLELDKDNLLSPFKGSSSVRNADNNHSEVVI